MGKTIENLTKAFIGESQARNRYSIYASAARKEGYLQISDIFEETAQQEAEHASWFFKMIQSVKEKEHLDVEEIEVSTGAFVKKGTTLENLGYAITGETHEFSQMYPEFANIAQEEGYPEIAARIRFISVAEKHHAERYKKLFDELNAKTLREKEHPVERVCSKCGYSHHGQSAPHECPSCGHDETYFIVKNEKY